MMVDFEGNKRGEFDAGMGNENAYESSSSQYQDADANLSPGTRILQPDANGAVTLPAGVSTEDIVVQGRDLVINLADGSTIIIPDGAIIVPQIVIDGVAIQPLDLAALLNAEEIDPEAGPQQSPSSGGNFAADEGAIQDAFDLGDLLPYTELSRPIEPEEEIIPFENSEPEVVIETPDNPTGVENAIATVDEEGLPERGDPSEPEGTNEPSGVENTSGTIVFDAPDGLSAIILNGVEISSVGQTFVTDLGVLTITSIDLGTGEIGFDYALTDNTLDPASVDTFDVTVVDTDGDTADAMLTVNIIDDMPIAFNDAGTIAAGTFGPINGNVLDNDVSGADGFPEGEGGVEAVTGFSNSGGSANPGESLQGEYGVLTLNEDGTYTYTRDVNTPGGVTDTFNYTIVDQDGSPANADLVITIEDAPDTIDFVPDVGEGTEVDEGGLPPRTDEPVGTGEGADGDPDNNDDMSETTGATIEFNSPDGLASITINGVDVNLDNEAGNDADDQVVIDDGTGTLVITSVTYDPNTGDGTITYEYTLADNTSGDDTSVEFDIVVTDLDGDEAADTLTIDIIDDEPEATNDIAGQANENEPIVIDALANDTFGADNVDTSDDTKVFVSTQATQGTVTYDPATGLFTYTPNPGAGSDSTEDSFQYTIIDGDGDPATATVTITLQPDSEPQGSERAATVDDDGLAGGNPASTTGDLDANVDDDPADTSEASFTGNLGFDVGNDTPATISVDPALDGTTAQVGTETVTYTVDGNTLTATGPRGVLFTVEITDPATGAYTVTLVDNVLHEAGGDENNAFVSIDFIVADSEGETALTNLSISFDDDAPTAVADTDEVTEDGPLTASGNVITDAEANGDNGADSEGADGAEVTAISFDGNAGTVGSALTSTYGELTLDADGGYTYELDNTNPLVQGLDSTESLTEVFTYTITDADGDEATTTLTITINGADDIVTINGLDLAAPELSLDEDDLADGSSPDAAALTKTGSFTVDSPDGLATLTVGGIAVFGGGVVYPVTIDDPTYGELTITGVTPTTDANGDVVSAEVFFSYTLQDNSLLHDESGEDNFVDSFEVIATDTDGSNDTASLDIEIVDDIPSITLSGADAPVLITDDTDLRNNPSSSDSGDFSTLFSPDFQADGPNAVDSLVYEVAITGGDGTDSGLNDTATGENILLRLNGDVIEGYLETSGDIAFTLTLDPDAGTIEQTQFRAIQHDNPNDRFETEASGEAETMAADLITITATITDGDGDQASETANIGDAFNFEDDGIGGGAFGAVSVDEDGLANGVGDTTSSGDDAGSDSGSALFNINFGADGPNADEITVSNATVSAFDPFFGPVPLTSGGVAIVTDWNASTNTLTGYTTDINDPVFTIVFDVVGETFTFNLLGALDHPSTDDGSGTLEGHEDNLQLLVDITVTDGDGDSFSFSFPNIFIDDDMAVATDNANSVGEGEQTSGNVVTDDDGGNGLDAAGADGYASDGPVVDANFADAGGVTLLNKSTAPDGTVTLTTSVGTLVIEANGDYTFTSNANSINVDTQLTFTYTIEDGDGDQATADLVIDIDNVAGNVSDNDAIVFEAGLDGIGSDGGSNSEFFTTGQIDVTNATGPFTYQLTDPATGSYGTLTLDPNTGEYSYELTSPIDGDSLAPSQGGDNGNNPINDQESFNYEVYDQANNLIGSGTIVVTIVDDVPEVDIAASGTDPDMLVTQDADTDPGPDTATGDVSQAFNIVTETYGADQPGTLDVTYAMALLATVDGVDNDTGLDSDGASIFVYQLADGTIVGSTAGAAPADESDPSVVFSISVDANSGEVTLTQYAEIDHALPGDTSAPYDTQLAELASGLVGVTATADIEDADGDTDTDSETVDLGGFVKFADDGPAIDASVTDGDTVMLVTQDAETIGTDTDTASSTANFSDAFDIDSFDYGADGAGMIEWDYSLEIENGTSGLSSNGAPITLYLIGGTVVGSTAGNIGDVDAANTIFDISVVEATGVVTLNQYAELDHPDNNDTSAPYDDQLLSLANDLVNLVGTATITDGDGDTAEETVSLDLGGNIKFADDGPSLSNVQLGSNVDVDETDGFPTSDTSAASIISFTSDFGADGPGFPAVSYEISVADSDSGLATAEGDFPITLVQAGANTINGVYTDGGGVQQTAFTVVINGNGTVTLTQNVALEHLIDGDDSAGEHNDTLDLTDKIEATVTLTDGDFDEASSTIEIGSGLVFFDDGPSVTLSGTNDSLTVSDADFGTDDSESFADNFTFDGGEDGTASTSYALSVVDGTDSGLVDTLTGEAILLRDNGGVIEGYTAGSNDVVFTVTVDGSGNVELDQSRAIDHDLSTGSDGSTVDLAADGSIQLIATITDNDGDTDSVALNIGENLNFLDDVPAAGANDDVQLDDETLAGGIAGGTGDVDPDTENTSVRSITTSAMTVVRSHSI